MATQAREATDAAISILKAGGNAADAAVAAALVLAVVYPNAGNLGGGGFAVIRMRGRTTSLDFRETAPSEASAGMYLGPEGSPKPLASLLGPLAAGIPGSPRGYFELHRRFGRLGWARVVAPAIRLARDGFPVSAHLARLLGSEDAVFLRAFEESRRVWLPEGRAPEAGRMIRLPALARTLQAYADRGPDAIMSGEVARAMVRVSTRHGGILSLQDLETYRPVWRKSLGFDAFGWHVASMGLPSSGGLILAESSALLEGKNYAGLPKGGADRMMLLAEAWKRAFADRYLLGDPASTRADVSTLLLPQRMERLAGEISLAKSTPSAVVRSIELPPGRESSETTHLSIIDGEGGAISLTTTLNGNFGCGLLVPEAGFLLNNEMDDFATAPGQANQFGLIQGEANAVAPGRRMLSSMSPTIAWNDEGDLIVLGAPGGSRIPTGTLQVLLHLIVDGEDLQAAVDAPRIHHQWLPDRLFAEEGALSPETIAVIRSRGLETSSTRAVGLVQAVRREADGSMEAATDPRGSGEAGVVGSESE